MTKTLYVGVSPTLKKSCLKNKFFAPGNIRLVARILRRNSRGEFDAQRHLVRVKVPLGVESVCSENARVEGYCTDVIHRQAYVSKLNIPIVVAILVSSAGSQSADGHVGVFVEPLVSVRLLWREYKIAILFVVLGKTRINGIRFCAFSKTTVASG